MTKDKAPQGRRYTVDTHPDREKIIAAVVKGDRSFRNIAEQFNISSSCISRYLNEKLAGQAAAVMARDGKQNGGSLLKRIKTVMARMQKMYDACDEYLRDPNNPEKYDLGPKAWEIDVTYRIPDPRDRKKYILGNDTLNNLLARLERSSIHPMRIKFRQADPRKLIIETASVLARQLELIGKIQGQFSLYGGGDTTVNVLVVNPKGEFTEGKRS